MQNISLQFDNTLGIEEAMSPRSSDDYSPHKLSLSRYTLPVNILRSLVNKESIKNLKEVAIKADIPDLHLAIVRHQIASSGNRYPLPLHFITSFTHSIGREKARIAGPVFISSLHSVLESPNLSAEQKAQTTEGILSEYLDSVKDYDLSIISMPKRKYVDHSFDIKPENSLTHTFLLRASNSLVHYQEDENSGLYFMAHKGNVNQKKRDILFNDIDLLSKITAVVSAWSTNFQREIQLSKPSELGKQQKEAVVESLVCSYS